MKAQVSSLLKRLPPAPSTAAGGDPSLLTPEQRVQLEDAYGGGWGWSFSAEFDDRIASANAELAKLDPATLARVYAVNAIGPALVAREFAGLLTVAGKERLKAGLPPAVLASLSARVGSVGDNGTGGWYAYRASKVSEREGGGGRRRRGCRAASLSRPLDRTLPSPPQTALNQLMKTAAVELARKRSGVAVACLHPGTCETDLSAPFRRSVPADKLFPVERGAAQLLDVIDALALEESGCFKAWDGSTIPW